MPSILLAAVAVLVLGTIGSAGASAEDSTPTPAASSPSAPSDGVGSSTNPLEVSGGSLPGQKPPRPETPEEQVSDAAPSLDPGFVDHYSQVWTKAQASQRRVQRLSGTLASARAILQGSWEDLSATMRQRGKSDAQLADAIAQYSVSIRDLYMTGSTDVDVLIGVMGSTPDDFLRDLDNIVYLRSATGNETLDYNTAQEFSTILASAQASAEIRAADATTRVATITTALTAAKKKAKLDEAELQRLISLAAPQTVVGKDGCPKAVLDGTVPVGIDVHQLCKYAVAHAVTPQAAMAVKYALLRLGAPYACGGIGRLDPWRYDCSSYVSRAYSEGAGLRTAQDGWAPSTRNMVPWDGASLDPHYAPISGAKLKPGDLVLYDTCPAGQTCPYRHVVMYLGPAEPGGVPLMAHTNGCGLVAHVESFWGTDVPNYLGSRRVMALPGEHLLARVPAVRHS